MTVNTTTLKTLVLYKGDASDLQIYADDGQAVVDEYLADISTSDLSSAMKDRIALYLAAHFYVVSQEAGGISSRKAGESQDNYRVPAADKVGFQSTRFGQQACAMDRTGTLIIASKATSGKAEFEVVKGPSTQPSV